MYQVLYIIFYKILETLFFSDIRSATSESMLQGWTKGCSAISYCIIAAIVIAAIWRIGTALYCIAIQIHGDNKNE